MLRRAARPGRKGLLIGETPYPWAEAAAQSLCLLTPEMHNRTLIDHAFVQAGVRPRPVIESNSILTLGLTVLVGGVSSVLPGALVSVFSGYAELEALPLSGPEIVTPIGFMYAKTAQPSRTLKAALSMAGDPDWMAHVKAHTGLLQPTQP